MLPERCYYCFFYDDHVKTENILPPYECHWCGRHHKEVSAIGRCRQFSPSSPSGRRAGYVR